MPATIDVEFHEARLRRHLSVLFPGYAGDRTALLGTLSQQEVDRAFRRIALECHPDRRRSGDAEMQRLAREQFDRARAASDVLREHACRRATVDSAAPARAVDAGDAVGAGRAPRLIAVGGAKGGVGKTTLAASLATALAMMGHRVTAVDLDLGGANLHLFLGIRMPARTLAHFWNEGRTALADVAVPTDVGGLTLVAGDSSTLGASNIGHFQKQRLLRQLRKVPADVVVVDLGGDTTFNTLDFLLHADEPLVVTTEDPAAVLDAYNMVKVGLLRALSRYVLGTRERPSFSPEAEARCQRFVAACGQPGAPALSGFLAELASIDRAAAAAVDGALERFRPRLVLNQAGPAGGSTVLDRVREVCRQHLRIDADPFHLVPADPEVTHLTRRLTNVVNARVDSEGARAIWAIAHTLMRAAGRAVSAAVRPAVHTRFFQPPWIFPLLGRALADLIARSPARTSPLRAWHVGAGTGEGTYSLAIALEEAIRQGAPFDYHVSATGARDDEIAQARRGRYPLVFVEALKQETLRRYFLRGTGLSAGMCLVKDAIRERVAFSAGPATLETLAEDGPADLVLLDMSAEAFSVFARSSGGRDLTANVQPGGLLIVPSWPCADLPVAGFTRLGDGIFGRARRANQRVQVA